MNNLTPVQTQNVGRMIKDMRFVGMFYIVYGGLTCLSIIGALIGVPMIISGLRLRESADYFSTFQNQNDENAMALALEKQGSFFNIMKILMIISLVIFAIYIVIAIFAGFAALLNIY